MGVRKEDGAVQTETQENPELTQAQALIDAVQSGDPAGVVSAIRALTGKAE